MRVMDREKEMSSTEYKTGKNINGTSTETGGARNDGKYGM